MDVLLSDDSVVTIPEPPALRWHVGHNTVGYCAEDIYCFEGSEDDARRQARGKAALILDDCDGCEIPDDEHLDSADLDNSGDYYLSPTDCAMICALDIHCWYAQCDTPEECAATED